ncbi:MAG: glycoside hydrolase family 2 protein [Bacteroidales bacterium]|nr:glycoside hydrolase family 2 protein [Bacteroidales bacterium]
MRENRKKTIISFILFFVVCTVYAQNSQYKTRLEGGWQFLKSDLGSVWEAFRPANSGSPETVPLWEEVTLPHCVNAWDAVDPDVNYYQGPAWYKTTLDINNPFDEGRTLLHFEGSGQKTELYVFTTKVASHVGGYDEWYVDITEAVKDFLSLEEAERFKGKVPIAIRTDNSRDVEMIPSDLSDFNLYGGIYRYLNLVYVPGLSLQEVYANASVDNAGKTGEVTISTRFYNPANIANAELEITITDKNQKVVFQSEKKLSHFDKEIVIGETTLREPHLWSPDSPDLYTLHLTLNSKTGTHEEQVKFGFRHFEFIKHGPFILNGERLLLRGTHRHEDHAGVGAAMTEEMMREEMILMKEMGVNFIRLGHYQQSRIILDLCDSLGILVWEEIPWCRGGLGGEVYQEQARRMLKNMIVQHRNHPSVILWGLGNENDWPNDFPYFDKEAIRAFMKELHDLSHEIDPNRLTAIRRCDFCRDIVDVYSPSIWAGWYRGRYTDYKRVSEYEKDRVDHFLHVEWGGDSHAGRHSEDPTRYLDIIQSEERADERAGDASLYGGKARASRDGEWTETYICDMIDWHLKEQETMDWLTGTAYWPFKDFSTPVRPENPTPYMNQKGVVERDLTPKESYYVFQSYWSDKPMVRIYGHTWPIRWGEKGEPKLVRIYSSCDNVELFHNGKSLGTKERNSQNFPAAGLSWQVVLNEGENHFKAVGKKEGVTVVHELTQTYQTEKWGEEAIIEAAIVDRDKDHVWIEAVLKDANGVKCLDSRNYIYFDLAGDGKMVDNRGTSTGSRKVQAFNGRARIKVLLNDGESRVAVKSPGLKSQFVTLQ